MLETLSGMIIFLKLAQFANVIYPMLVTPLGMTMLAKPVPVKALSPMLVTLSGITKLVRLLHPQNAAEPILVMLVEKVILLKFWQS